MKASEIRPGDRSITFATAAAFIDADAIKQSIATSTSAAEYTTTALNGALGDDMFSTFPRGRRLGVTRSSDANQFSTDPYTVSAYVAVVTTGGLWTVDLQTLTATPDDDDGGDIVYFDDVPVVQVVSWSTPVMGGTGGTHQLGVFDMYAPPGPNQAICRELICLEDSTTIKVGYPAPHADLSEVTDTLVAAAGRPYPVAPYRIYGDGDTDGGFTLLI